MSIFCQRMRSIPLLSLGVAMACNDPSDPNETSRANLTSSAVIPAAASTIPKTSSARIVEERRLIDSLLSILTPEQRQVARDVLEKDESRIYSVQNNKAAAELLGRIYAIRDAEQDHKQRTMMRHAATEYVAPVTVALVDSFAGRGVQAKVIRDPMARPDNIVVLSRRSLSPRIVAAALAMLDASRLRYGEVAAKRVQLTLTDRARAPRLNPEQEADARALIDRLNNAQRQDVKQVGRSVAAVTISRNPVSASRGSR